MQSIIQNLNLADLITYGVCALIIIISFFGVKERRKTSNRNRRIGPWTSLAPSAVISLGILGTFGGIFLGLINFDTSDINKIAFLTCLTD